ncbi:MAG TPA: ABC transporter permease [Gaiellaceae bacterium]|jgi:oligopeptide transport system permease protein
MAAFILRRLFWTIPVILLVILMTFLLMKNIGGNPFRKTERAVPPAVQANLERQFNLDKPWWQQYVLYVKDVATFDFGPSIARPGTDVNTYIEEQFPRSIKLGFLAFIFAVIVGLPAGVIAALRPNSILDYTVMFFSNIGFAIPSFLVATLLIYYFAVKVNLLPTSGWPLGFWQYDARMVLPVFALGLLPMAYFARLVRGSMLETMQQDYVRTAKAKGLRHKRIIGYHVLRNSLIPVVTAAGPLLGYLITGSFVIEYIFSIPGIGRGFIQGVSNRDYSVVMALTVLLSLVVIFANLVVDILYGFLDPRTRGSQA